MPRGHARRLSSSSSISTQPISHLLSSEPALGTSIDSTQVVSVKDPSQGVEAAATATLAEEEYVIRCVCGEDDAEGFQIQCEQCFVWQHGICVGYPSEKDCPENYYCELCRPEGHPVYWGNQEVQPKPRKRAYRKRRNYKSSPQVQQSSLYHHHHLDKQHLERHHHETTTTSLSMVGKNGDKSSIPTNLATAMGTATSVEGVERGGGGSSSSNGTTTSGRKDNQMLLQNLISKTTDSRGRSRLRVAGRFTSQAALAKAIMETVPTTGISHKSSNRSDKSAHSGDDLIALIQPSSVNSQLDQLEASDDELMFDAFSTRRIKRMRSNDPDDEVGGVAALRGKRSKPGTPSPLESNGRSGSPYPLYYSSSYPHHHHHHHHNPAAIATTTTRDNNNGGSPSFKPRTVPQRSSLPDMQKRARDMMRWISMLQIDMAAREGSAIMDESMDGKERRRAVLEQAEQVTKMLTVWQRKWESLETGSLPNTS